MNNLYSITEGILQSVVQIKCKFFLDIEALQSKMLQVSIFRIKATTSCSSVYAYATLKNKTKQQKQNTETSCGTEILSTCAVNTP